MTSKNSAYIAGLWQSTATEFPVFNPADGTLIANVSDCGVQEANQAIEAACEAFPKWEKLSVKVRAGYLHRIKELLIEHRTQMASILTKENGKPIKEAEGEVNFAASFFEWFAEEGRRAYGDQIPAPLDGKQLITLRQPVGVVALITPWNFPIAMLARKVAAALAAGCTVIIKPAEDTPLTALYFAQICEAAQIPAGVINILPCGREKAQAIGETICQSLKVAALSFTGSTAVGQQLYTQCATSMKRLAMELGGNAFFIIFESASVQLAVQGLMASKFRNTGQTCVTANRILVQRKLFDQVVEALAAAMDRELKVGPGSDPTNTQGPLINQRQLLKVDVLVRDALSKGAKAIRGGRKHPAGDLFYEPTLLVDVTTDMQVFREEIFGPVAALVPFDTEEEALRISNDCDRGLAGYFYTSDLRQAWRVGRSLQVGLLGINDPLISTCEAPFGGVKMSGFGKEGSKHGLEEFTNIKLLSFGALD